MILKLVSTAAAAMIVATTSAQAVKIRFIEGLTETGHPGFDVQVPRDAWPQFSGGEVLDAHHPEAGPLVREALYNTIETITRKIGMCPHGWVLTTSSRDRAGTYHFRGICADAAAA